MRFFFITSFLLFKLFSFAQVKPTADSVSNPAKQQQSSAKWIELERDNYRHNRINETTFINLYLHFYYLNKYNHDSIFKYVNLELKYYPVEGCYLFFDFPSPPHLTDAGRLAHYPQEIKRIRYFCDSVKKSFDKKLMQLLEKISDRDQKYRTKYDNHIQTAENKKKWTEQTKIDSLNLLLIDSIIKARGYPGIRMVGRDLDDAAFFVILRSNKLEVLNKYVPTIEKAIDERQLGKSVVPFLYDKICMLKGEPQRFGTQVIYNETKKRMEVYKIEDHNNVNKRREKYDLGSLHSYLSSIGAYLPNE